jgi:hypothetical protein
MFEGIKNLFVEVEKTPDKSEEITKNEIKKRLTPIPAAPSIPPIGMSASVNEDMAKVLNEAIETAKTQGFDYLKFRNSLVALAAVPMPEPQKFQTVFATAQTMGLTKETLLSSVDFFQQILDKKKAEFLESEQSIVAQEVTSRENTKAQKEQEIADLQEKIRQAQTTIAEKQQENLTLTSEINEQNLRIQQTAAAFEATFAFVSGNLQADKTKIQTYLADK